MPKTYNNRQLEQMRLEAEHAPPVADKPDVLPYIRPFSHEEIAALIERIVARVAMGRVVQLKPDTAYLAARALRAYNAAPSRQSIVREICGVRGGCEPQCVGCIGKANAIMALYEGRTRPLAFFAGIWCSWTSVRKVKEGETTNDLFGFLTTEPNKEVAPVHAKAMPVILTKPDEVETWLTADWPDACKLQRKLPDDTLRIVATGKKKDEAA